MRKLLILLALSALTSVSYAAVEIAQAVITDCGTVHNIPSDSTEKEACEYLDYWSARDCR